MAEQIMLFLFGDQTYDIQPYLKDLMRHRHNPVLEDFLLKAFSAIRSDLYRLPHEIRDDLPRFACLDDIIFQRQRRKRCVPLDMALTCLYQLGLFISQIGDRPYYGDDIRILGLCTGALAAAAVSCSRSTLELVPMAVDAVTIAFRTGMCVIDTAKRIDTSNLADQSWSMIVPGLESGEAAMQNFVQETKLPLTSQPYISAYSPNGVVVSAPPFRLAQLVSSEHFKGLRSQTFQIYGPYHAPHLYSQVDVDEIVRSLDPYSLDTRLNQIPLYSSTGASVKGGNFETLLRAAVEQILLQPIRWSGILRELQNDLQKSESKTFSITPIGTKADQLIYSALRQTSLRCSLRRPLSQSQVPPSGDGLDSGRSEQKLAIIGMSGRYPDAEDNEAFWNILHQGLDVHKPVPALHWDVKTHVDPTGNGKNTSSTSFGCWLTNPAAFDARFFNISPREAPQIDPAQRLALMTAYEAIEQAGIVPDATPSTRRDRVGVFYGVTSMDWMETNSAQNIDTYFIPGGNRAFIPGRINYFYKFSGPSFAIDTACSSSLAGIHLACNSLWKGDIDTAIAGGTNVLTNPDMTSGLDKGHFLSRTGNCKTFDDSADGYCRGEGVGTVILKRFDDALADNDPILGVILSASTNHSAESESITRPHIGAQREIYNKIMNQSGVDPFDVNYIEMHGTGTQAGDAGEMSSVLDTFAPPPNQIQKSRSSNEALYLGSAKANIGHGESASGVSSLIKVLLMMQKNTIVPHCGIKTKINQKFPTDLQERNVNIAFTPTPWKRSSDPSKPRRALVNNFSAAGGNSAVLIEDPPLKRDRDCEATDPRRHHVVAFSAKTGVSLQGNLTSMLKYLKQSPSISLGKLSYTTTVRRLHHQHRVMLTGSSGEEICTQIEVALRDQIGMTRPKSAPNIIFIFTGQGAQYPGMMRELFENFSLFRTEVRRLDQIGQSLGFPSILPVIESVEQAITGFPPIAVQLASVCTQIALSKLWASWNTTPSAVVGHSLGEYAALNVSGVLSDTDTIYLVGKRAELLQAKCMRDTHAMLVVNASVDEVAGVLKNKTYEIACINSPTETVLAGPNDDVSILIELLADWGVKSKLLSVPYAFHSSQINPVLLDFEEVARGVSFSKPRIPVICPLDGTTIDDIGKFGPNYLARHSRESVNMLKALLVARSSQIITDRTVMIEIGPHPAISGMVRAVLGPQVTSLASSQRGRPAFQVLAAAMKTLYVAGADIRWSKYHCDFKVSQEVLPLPAYSWDLKDYWIQYVNDWSLRKGDPPLKMSHRPTLESTTIHRVIEEMSDSQKARIVVEANIAQEDFSPLVQGHEVDGIPLCTPSVYAEIALNLGRYILKRHLPDQKDNIVDVSDMVVSKALILHAGATRQLLQVQTEVDWSSNVAAVKFMSFDNHKRLQEHARCVVSFKDKSLQQTLQNDAKGVKQKMQALREGIITGVTARYNRSMMARAIRSLARFSEDYKAIDEIILNSNTLEASSHISFACVKKAGTYHTHPAIIESLTQSCGYTMNCNDGNDLDVDVFMIHGWKSFQIFEPMELERDYTTYTQVSEGQDKLWHGDVVVFDGENVVAHFGQIVIQSVPRRVLKAVLAIESGNKAPKQHSTQKQKPLPALPAPILNAARSSAASNNGISYASKLTQALSIIAEESGLALTDLTNDTNFGDVGVDSLLGLTISARLKDELDVDLDSNGLFFECPTVGHLKKFLGETKDSTTGFSSVSSLSDMASFSRSSASTPNTEEESLTPEVDFQRALLIISEESGVATEDLTEDTNFSDAGIDSLLSLVIVSRLREELELNIQHEFLFIDCPTVGDLKKTLLGQTHMCDGAKSSTHCIRSSSKATGEGEEIVKENQAPAQIDNGSLDLAARKDSVDDYVRKYTAGFLAPISSHAPTAVNDNAKVVLVTGASGSLGGHLVDQIAQIADVKKVICLNREKTTEPYLRQEKAMKDKGIHSFDKVKPKLVVLQTDSWKPMLGLSSSEYEGLLNSVTHVIHNAWPMSVKRPLVGFESQFQIMRNLIDFARDVVSRHLEGFKFSFQLVSSVSVVGTYRQNHTKETTFVPEDRHGIDAVMPSGYGDAKWGCERMLDETLHRYPHQFRPMVVRLGQIAGSKTSGHWNTSEHFAFVIKSSQMLNALPDTGGTVYWTPVNDIAGTLIDLILSDRTPYPVYHIDNPVGQPWRKMNLFLADALNISDIIPFEEWIERVRAAPQRNNPAALLLEFLDSNYLRMSCGGLVLDVKKTLEHSKTLSAVGPVSEELVNQYIRAWKEIGFLG